MSGLLSLIEHLLQGVEGPERLDFLSALYSDESVVACVFSHLNSLEKSILSKMLLIDRSMNESLILHWLTLKGVSQKPLLRLSGLGIVTLGNGTVILNPNFQNSLVTAIHHIVPISAVWRDEETQDSKPTTSSSWHAVLERIISSTTLSTMTDIDRVTLRLGFGVNPTPPAAYTFVLASTSEQLWTLLSEFVAIIESQRGGGGLVAVSRVLRTVCGLKNRANSFSKISKDEICDRTIEFLKSLNILRPVGDDKFVFGSTGPNLFSGGSGNAIVAKLLVDSNMHVTAYTQSLLQVKLVSLFCQVQRIIGKVVVGILTRASVQKAIDAGVSSQTITAFLSQNLHPDQKFLPPNVSLQIKLWEADCPRNRLVIEPVTVFSWRGDRNEQANKAIVQLKALAESHKGLMFVKQEPDGKISIGIKSEIAKTLQNI